MKKKINKRRASVPLKNKSQDLHRSCNDSKCLDLQNGWSCAVCKFNNEHRKLFGLDLVQMTEVTGYVRYD